MLIKRRGFATRQKRSCKRRASRSSSTGGLQTHRTVEKPPARTLRSTSDAGNVQLPEVRDTRMEDEFVGIHSPPLRIVSYTAIPAVGRPAGHPKMSSLDSTLVPEEGGVGFREAIEHPVESISLIQLIWHPLFPAALSSGHTVSTSAAVNFFRPLIASPLQSAPRGNVSLTWLMLPSHERQADQASQNLGGRGEVCGPWWGGPRSCPCLPHRSDS